ncbi:hypothetical protein A3I25_00950 [Candidatus Nomurabacteria bacterium RIFCSPLOWO2_02_FULL_42_17]|uniref:Ribosome-binding factor A n=2 Tax=Candidatus Nomuraibacteriota TaxID=1752729 RepID=A0A1F6WFP3_9BACT|nr:MAG: hypothetical protein A3B93_01255 [Candidatus Nomurabacteria bacterium RIFCSPHIGHO2_02_FULL_42_24]OGI96881.1 MAG: hypothetical protein A3I25_00950 [Candidatus Nomurabacteria bacterium RIFCSPLOWO2_02_FULL_42_17]
MSHHQEKLESLIMQLTAEFLERKSPPSQLVTVISCNLSSDSQTVNIGLSIFPESAGAQTLIEIQKLARRLRFELGEKIRSKKIPAVHFTLQTHPLIEEINEKR